MATSDDLANARDAARDCLSASWKIATLLKLDWAGVRGGLLDAANFGVDAIGRLGRLRESYNKLKTTLPLAQTTILMANAKAGVLCSAVIGDMTFSTFHEAAAGVPAQVLAAARMLANELDAPDGQETILGRLAYRDGYEALLLDQYVVERINQKLERIPVDARYKYWEAFVLRLSELPVYDHRRIRTEVEMEWARAVAFLEAHQAQDSANTANSPRLFAGGVPENTDVLDLVAELDSERNKGKSKNQIAREFTGGDEKKAQSLLSQIRRLRKQGKLTL